MKQYSGLVIGAAKMTDRKKRVKFVGISPVLVATLQSDVARLHIY